jgi:hypothetical protein
MLDTANNTFSGDLRCDPVTVNVNCGVIGRRWCGSDASCALYYASGEFVGEIYGSTVGVGALPITNITTIR